MSDPKPPDSILTIVGGIGAKIATDRLTSLLDYGVSFAEHHSVPSRAHNHA